MSKSIIIISIFIFIMNTYTYTKELSKNAIISGNIKGIGKGQIYVVLYPVNLGNFDSYDVSPISIKCNESGKFTSDLRNDSKLVGIFRFRNIEFCLKLISLVFRVFSPANKFGD